MGEKKKRTRTVAKYLILMTLRPDRGYVFVKFERCGSVRILVFGIVRCGVMWVGFYF